MSDQEELDYYQKQKIRISKDKLQTKRLIGIWLAQGRPDKCVPCLHMLNYCRWWEKGYSCEKHETEKGQAFAEALFRKRTFKKPRAVAHKQLEHDKR